MTIPATVHKFGTKATILLTGVFGPYAQDDEYGSRAINPMELYQNQVTRTQGIFSLRMFHRTFGLVMLQANIDAPCTLLDFPSLDDFTREIKRKPYDIVGVSAIMTNIAKVKTMCALIRKHQPQAVIVIGGHIANVEGLAKTVDADHIVKGDGIAWFRKYLGQDENAPVRHPVVSSAFGARIMGINLPNTPSSTAAILIPSVGCPLGCNFCSTSAMFGGKGKFVSFFQTGDELFSVMCKIESELRTSSFFVLDENFLFHRKRALRLLELMELHGKAWSLHVFSSARVIQSYTYEQLTGLGVSWVWMGLEGEDSRYPKLSAVDTRALVREMQSHGIRVLGSSIIGLENHTPENIEGIIDHAVSHNTDFHQFMLYTPVPGTPLHREHQEKGDLLPEAEFPFADSHGQYRFNYRHPSIPAGREESFLLEAFNRDFLVNGPSLARLIGTTLQGWRRYKNHPDPRIRSRFLEYAKELKIVYAAAVWAMRKWFRNDPHLAAKMNSLLRGLYQEFGVSTRLAAPVLGRIFIMKMKKEEKRLAQGRAYEPGFFVEKNPAALALEQKQAKSPRSVRASVKWVTGGLAPALAQLGREPLPGEK
ncbi:MAG: cobalamin-dependent protein [Pseudomonadota bacterium]